MVDNPYINKQNWGKDLLARLNNFSNEDGSFNVWDELPTVGNDGNPLNEEHSGLTGILYSQQSRSFVTWDGHSWQVLFQSPFVVEGEKSETLERSFESRIVYALDPSYSSEFYFVVQNGSGTIIFSKIRKSDHSTVWVSTISLPVESSTFLFLNGRPLFEDALNGKVFLSATVGASINGTEKAIVFCISGASGVLLWQRLIPFAGNDFSLDITADNLACYVSLYSQRIVKINALSGIIEFEVTLSTELCSWLLISSSYLIAITQDTTTNALLFIHKLEKSNLISIGSNVPLYDASSRTIIKEVCEDVQAENLFYFNAKSSNEDWFIWEYNTFSGELTQLAPNLWSQFVLTLAEKRSNSYLLRFSSGESLIEVEISASGTFSQPIFSFPGGLGSVLAPQKRKILWGSELSPLSLKVATTIKGYGNSQVTSSTVFSSLVKREVVQWTQGSVIFGSSKILVSESTFNSIYSDLISTKKINSSKIRVDSAPGGANTPSNIDSEINGINIGDVGYLFSVIGSHISNSGLVLPSGQGYADGRIVCGLSVNCKAIAGRVVSAGVSLPDIWGSSGIFFFDVMAGMWVMNSAGGQQAGGAEVNLPTSAGFCLNGSNNAGFGTITPAYKVDVTGTLRATTLMNSGGTVTSDERIKVGIVPLDGISLWEIWNELQAISFLYKPDFSFVAREVYTDKDGNEVVTEIPQKWPLPQGIQYGWSAQQVQEYLPELVTEDRQTGILYLNREALFPIFQSAATAKIQQLEEMIVKKESTLTQLQSALESLTARVEALENAAA